MEKKNERIGEYLRLLLHHIGDVHQPLHAINVLDYSALGDD